MEQIKRWGLLIFLMILLGIFFYLRLHDYLSFSSLKAHREILFSWIDENFIEFLLSFIAIYIITVAISIPIAVFFSIAAGFLFGPILGTMVVVTSATIGAFIVFLAVEFALRDWMAQKTTKWLKIMKQGFKQNSFSYLLFLRIIPIFPFWVINIVPALLGVPRLTYITATFIGIIPGSIISVMIGDGLDDIFATDEKPNLNIFLQPKIFLPLLALSFLSLLPIVYKYIKKNHNNRLSKKDKI